MSLKNTAANYGSVAKWVHWGTALLFLVSFGSVYLREWLTEPKTPANMAALHIHLSVGISLGVIVALRVIWRLMNRAPQNEPGSPMAHRAAHAGHLALYAVMILAPVTGYLATGLNANYFFLFEIPSFKNTELFQVVVVEGMGLDFKTFREPLSFIHKEILGTWLIGLLVLGHAGAALYHHYVLRDRTLVKMTTGK